MFKYKTEKELLEMSEAERDQYTKDMKKFEADSTKEAIKVALEQFKKDNPNPEPSITKDEVDNMKDKIKELEEKGGQYKGLSMGDQIRKGLEDNHDKIKSVLRAKHGLVEIEVKAPADITTANGVNTAPPNLTGTQMAPISNVNLRDIMVMDRITILNTSLAAYPYTEAKPKEGDFAFVAEGGLKPQIDFTWETNYAKPKKAAAWLRLTEEAVDDVVGLQSVATDYLFKKHNLFKSRAILYGDGIGENARGATTYGRGFSAGPMALQVANPNFMDLVNAAIVDIATTHNYADEIPYMPNLAMVNYNDFFIQFVSAKDGQGLPLYPQASLFNSVTIGNVTIVPEESIPAGKLFVADMKMYNLTNYKPYTVKVGWVNDDFIRNQFVILGESRFHSFVKKMDQQAFLYDDIATIKTAITKP